MLSKARSRLAEAVRNRLDVRYVRVRPDVDFEHLAARLADIDARLARVEGGLIVAKKGGQFVANEEPNELRKMVFNAHRLANECAISIERLLQADLLLRRDLEAATGVDSIPTV